MIEKIILLFHTYQTEIRYLIIGGCTTLVNFVVYLFCRDICGFHYLLGNGIAWILSVLFAYYANRKWVFESKNAHVIKEAFMFYSSRLFSGGAEFLLLFLFVDLMQINDVFAKIVISVLVVILNYVTSKWMVFRKTKGKP